MAMFEGIIQSGLTVTGFTNLKPIKARTFNEAGDQFARMVARNNYGRHSIVRGCTAGDMVGSMIPYTAWVGCFGDRGIMDGKTITVMVGKKS